MILHRAVVEDNNDPEKLNRVRVRIHGVHTNLNENSAVPFAFVKTSDLPWAEVMGSTAFGLVGGVGVSSTLRQGTWVWVLLEMEDHNKPVIIGTITGINTEDPIAKASTGNGFYDPDEVHPFRTRSKETDINRLARAEKLSEAYYDKLSSLEQRINGEVTPKQLDSTVHDKINNTLNKVTETDGGVSGSAPTFSEPPSLSDKTIYPDCAVVETQAGHVIEIDDTSGNERIRVYHTSGSYFEIRPDGSFVQKSVGDENYYMHSGAVNEQITSNVKRYVSGNLDEIIKGYIHRYVAGEINEHYASNTTVKIDGSSNVRIDGGLTLNGGPKIDIDAGRINLN